MLFQKLRLTIHKAIEDAKSFEEIHSVWLKCYDDNLAVEDMVAYLKMKVLVTTACVKKVLDTFFDDVGIEVLQTKCKQYEVILLACKYATPQSAHEALKSLQ